MLCILKDIFHPPTCIKISRMAWYKFNINLTRNPPYDSPYLRTDQLAGPILPLAFANLLWVLYTTQVTFEFLVSKLQLYKSECPPSVGKGREKT